ncbi:MAG TPA: substrate-binding domain-containing protein [Bryobacteraceae bacterium]|nr:substrate-binding domain-containing protein [Bryobacteraceae bacterium]
MTKRTLTRRQGLALAALPFLPACNRDTKKRIGVIPKGRAHIFWQSVHAGANKAARENGVEIEWNGPVSETDFNGQLQIAEAMINKRMDAILLAPIDKKAMVSVVERAAKQGIPVIIFDSPVDTEQFVAQVATDNYRGGQIAAERMGEILGGKGKVAIVAVQAGAASTMAREQGFEDNIKAKFPGIQIVDKRYGEAMVERSLSVTENMLTAHPELSALFASNESSTVGAARALKARGSKIRLVGFDSGPTLEEDLKAGVIDSLVVQDPFRMGYDSVNIAVRKLKGETPQKIQNLEATLVTKADLEKSDIQALLRPDLKKYLD